MNVILNLKVQQTESCKYDGIVNISSDACYTNVNITSDPCYISVNITSDLCYISVNNVTSNLSVCTV